MSELDNMDVDTEETGSVVEVGVESTMVEQPAVKKIKPKKFEIKKWTAVAFWSWDIAVDNCAICRNHIMEPCITCQPLAMTDTDTECVAAWGVCNHAFHLHCINKWLKTRDVCPLDNQPWKLARVGR